MQKWDLVPSANCRCGAEEQTADHIIASCPLYHPLKAFRQLYHPPNTPSYTYRLPVNLNGTLGLAALDDDTADWLQKTELSI